MAKVKMTLAEKRKQMLAAINKTNDKIGKTVMGFASHPDIQEKLTIKWVLTPSLRINEATGGGLPRGKVCIVQGDPDSGKTSLLLEVIGYNMQRDPDFMALWLEAEESIELSAIRDMFKIDLDRFVVIYLDRDGAAEVALDRLESALGMGVFDMCVINSLKCLTPSTEFEKEMGAMTIGLQSRMNGKLMRKMTSLIAENDCVFAMTNHLSTNIGQMHGDPLIASGGRAIAYSSMLTLDLRKRSIQDSDPVSREVGLKVGVTVRKNHCKQDRMPYLKTEYFVIYGEGIERSIEIVDVAEKCGILTKKGSWYREYGIEVDKKGEPLERILEDGTKAAWNGMKNIRNYLAANNDYLEYLVNKVENFGKVDVEALSEEEIEKIKQDEELNARAAQKSGITLDDIIQDPDQAPGKKKKK